MNGDVTVMQRQRRTRDIRSFVCVALATVATLTQLPACFGSSDDGAAGAGGNASKRCPDGARCVADGDAGMDAGGDGNDTLTGVAGANAVDGGAGGTGGGEHDAGSTSNDTWSAEGWNDRTPELLPIVWPEARMGHALAYDSAREKVVMYGGGNTGNRFDDVWERDASGAWSEVKPGVERTPVQRIFHGMTYDVARSRTVVFGGQGIVATIGDVWDYDGTSGTWTAREIAQGAPWPLGRNGHSFLFAPEVGRSVAFGGCCDWSKRDVWEWNGAAGAWTDVTPTPLPKAWPAARRYHAMVRDPERGVLVMFGGAEQIPPNDNVAVDDLWEYDPAAHTWTDRTPATRPAAWPAARFMHAMAYDEARQTIVLFGGTEGGAAGAAYEGLSDLWEYDASDGTWTEVGPTDPDARPAARWAHAMVYDQARESVVMFGGLTHGSVGEEALRDTWEYRP